MYVQKHFQIAQDGAAWGWLRNWSVISYHNITCGHVSWWHLCVHPPLFQRVTYFKMEMFEIRNKLRMYTVHVTHTAGEMLIVFKQSNIVSIDSTVAVSTMEGCSSWQAIHTILSWNCKHSLYDSRFRSPLCDLSLFSWLHFFKDRQISSRYLSMRGAVSLAEKNGLSLKGRVT